MQEPDPGVITPPSVRPRKPHSSLRPQESRPQESRPQESRPQASSFKAQHTPNFLQRPCPGLYSLKAFFHFSLGPGKLSGPVGSPRFRARSHLLCSLALPGRKAGSESENEGLGTYKLGTTQRQKQCDVIRQASWYCIYKLEYSLAIKKEPNLIYT